MVRTEIKKMVSDDIFVSSDSAYCMVVIIKKSGDVRSCLDSREINKIIVPDNEKPGDPY